MKTLTDIQRNTYKEIYLETYSVSEIMRRCNDGVGRGKITDYLKHLGIYEGLKGENYLKHKARNHEKLMLEKYGVTNWGQVSGGYKLINSIPYDKLPFNDEYVEYCKKVKTYTDEVVKDLKRKNMIPTHCEYTGILFSDEEYEKVNPNDYRKRSIDHIKPILLSFFDNDSPSQVGCRNNLAFTLKYINNVKGNSTLESMKSAIDHIRLRFIKAGASYK